MELTPEGRLDAAKAALALGLALRGKDVEGVQALLGPVDPTEVALAAAGLMGELAVFVGEKLDPPKTRRRGDPGVRPRIQRRRRRRVRRGTSPFSHSWYEAMPTRYSQPPPPSSLAGHGGEARALRRGREKSGEAWTHLAGRLCE